MNFIAYVSLIQNISMPAGNKAGSQCRGYSYVHRKEYIAVYYSTIEYRRAQHGIQL